MVGGGKVKGQLWLGAGQEGNGESTCSADWPASSDSLPCI